MADALSNDKQPTVNMAFGYSIKILSVKYGQSKHSLSVRIL